MAASVNHTVRRPRCRSASLYSDQLVTRRFGRGIWWRRAALALCGMKATSERQEQPPPYAIPPIRATRWGVPELAFQASWYDRCRHQYRERGGYRNRPGHVHAILRATSQFRRDQLRDSARAEHCEHNPGILSYPIPVPVDLLGDMSE